MTPEKWFSEKSNTIRPSGGIITSDGHRVSEKTFKNIGDTMRHAIKIMQLKRDIDQNYAVHIVRNNIWEYSLLFTSYSKKIAICTPYWNATKEIEVILDKYPDQAVEALTDMVAKDPFYKL